MPRFKGRALICPLAAVRRRRGPCGHRLSYYKVLGGANHQFLGSRLLIPTKDLGPPQVEAAAAAVPSIGFKTHLRPIPRGRRLYCLVALFSPSSVVRSSAMPTMVLPTRRPTRRGSSTPSPWRRPWAAVEGAVLPGHVAAARLGVGRARGLPSANGCTDGSNGSRATWRCDASVLRTASTKSNQVDVRAPPPAQSHLIGATERFASAAAGPVAAARPGDG